MCAVKSSYIDEENWNVKSLTTNQDVSLLDDSYSHNPSALHSWPSCGAAKVHVTVCCASGAIVLLSEFNFKSQEASPTVSLVACTLERQFSSFKHAFIHILTHLNT